MVDVLCVLIFAGNKSNKLGWPLSCILLSIVGGNYANSYKFGVVAFSVDI